MIESANMIGTEATAAQTEGRKVAVQTKDLVRRFGDLVAVDHLNMTVYEGDLFGFIGSNGAGKTTTLRILATFLRPTEGTAEILGYDIQKEADTVRRLIGFMPDFFGVYRDMEVSEYLDFFGACYRIPAARREKMINDVLELVGLSHKRGALIGALSRGMQQRLGLARVLIHDPKVLLLDEPASGLDPRARIEVMAILKELQRMGKTIIISSHILSELQNLCNRVGIIEKGRLIYCGSMEEMHRELGLGHILWVRIRGNLDQAAQMLRELDGITQVQVRDGALRVGVNPSQCDAARVAERLVQSGFGLLELRPEGTALEEVFLRLTRGETQ